MGKIIASEYLTLDGVMEEPGTWSFQFWNEEASKFKYDELFSCDALLLGRVTYEGFAKAWPTMKDTGDFGERMNGIRKFVVSTTLKKAEWNNSTIIRENVAGQVSMLKQQPGQDIPLSGSGQLAHMLMEHELIDEYRLMVHPVIMGSGKRLFKEGSAMRVLKLVDTKTFSSGVVILSYQPDKKE